MQTRILQTIGLIKGRIKIISSRQGFEIRIPNPNEGKFEDSSYGQAFFIWGLVGIFLLIRILSNYCDGTITCTLPNFWELIGLAPQNWIRFIALAAWFLIEIVILLTIAHILWGCEKVIFSPMALRIGKCLLGFGKWRTYSITGITNFKVVQPDSSWLGKWRYERQGKLQCEVEGKTVKFGKHLQQREARDLAKFFSPILAFRCYLVQRIIFGDLRLAQNDSERTIQNPDVTRFAIPFVALQEVIIDAATYDFHQVERFLTYAVNYIGQEYLKEQVEVHIYGDPEQLQPNLRNSLANLCKSVTVH